MGCIPIFFFSQKVPFCGCELRFRSNFGRLDFAEHFAMLFKDLRIQLNHDIGQ